MFEIQEIMNLPNWREPVVGEDICVKTSLYLGHGIDDFQGGLCKIARIEDRRDDSECTALDFNKLSVETEERPNCRINWYFLISEEKDNLERYGDRRGYPDPDDDPRFNDWAL